MKSLLYFSLLIFSNFSWGQTCPGASKEMTDYLAQATWKASRVSDPKVAPVDGFTNSAGQFLFGDLTRGGKYEAELKVSPTNRSFTKYCRDRKRYGSYLSSMRWERENNEYRIRVQYLPSIDGQAFKTQGFKVSRSDVRVEMGRDSIVVNEEYDSSSIRQEIQNRISKQLAQ